MVCDYSPEYIAVSRFYNSNILNPAVSFESVAKSLLGVQSQIKKASAITFSTRTASQKYTSYIESCNSMNLIRIWGIRTTLHSYTCDDWKLILSQVTSADNWFSKNIKKRGVNLDDLVARAIDILVGSEYVTREHFIHGGIPEEYVGSWGDLLIELNNRGLICHTERKLNRRTMYKSMVYGNQEPIEIPKLSNLNKCEIATRYFAAYGPATKKDFSHWLGIGAREADRYIAEAKHNLCCVTFNGINYFEEKMTQKKNREIFSKYRLSQECWLLPKFDPLLLAYADKTWLVEEKNITKVWKAAGHVDGVVVQDWKAVATWRYQISNGRISFFLSAFDNANQIPINKSSLQERCAQIADFFDCGVGEILIESKKVVEYETQNINY